MRNEISAPSSCKGYIQRGRSYGSMFKNILVAVDGSKFSDAAFDAAADLAQKYSARLIVIHVFQGSSGRITVVSGVNEDVSKSVGQEVVKSYERRLQSRKDLKKVKILLKKGDAASRIIETANSEQAELVVLGSRGRGGFKGLLLGSVSLKVANHVKCPVYIVR